MKGVSRLYIFFGSIFVLGAVYILIDLGDWGLSLGFLFVALWNFWIASRAMK